MMCVIFECSADTIRRRVGTLVNTGDIDETQNCVSLTNVQAFGYNTTTLYNLNVQIVWACFLSMLFASGLIIGSSTIINRKRKGGWTSHPIRQWSSRDGLWNDKITCIIGEYHAEHKVRYHCFCSRSRTFVG